MSEQYTLKTLHEAALTLIVNSFQHLIGERELCNLDAKSLETLLKSDDILVYSEKDVFTAMTRWIVAAENERLILFPALM